MWPCLERASISWCFLAPCPLLPSTTSPIIGLNPPAAGGPTPLLLIGWPFRIYTHTSFGLYRNKPKLILANNSNLELLLRRVRWWWESMKEVYNYPLVDGVNMAWQPVLVAQALRLIEFGRLRQWNTPWAFHLHVLKCPFLTFTFVQDLKFFKWWRSFVYVRFMQFAQGHLPNSNLPCIETYFQRF